MRLEHTMFIILSVATSLSRESLYLVLSMLHGAISSVEMDDVIFAMFVVTLNVANLRDQFT